MLPTLRHHGLKYGIPAVLTAVALIIGLSTTLQEILQFDRTAITNGELWRLITGNLAHLNAPHLWMNTAGLWLIWLLLHHRLNPQEWGLCLLVTALGVGTGLYLLSPEIHWYVGLSGMLHGMILAPLIRHFRRNCLADYLLLTLVTGKTLWEQFGGPMEASESLIGGHVITEAHLYGAVSGAILAIGLNLFSAKPPPKT